jgi:hypothetical protein
METLIDPQPAEHEVILLRGQETDWTEHLGFDPALYGIDVGMGIVDGNHIGIMSACVCAISRNGRWQAYLQETGSPDTPTSKS